MRRLAIALFIIFGLTAAALAADYVSPLQFPSGNLSGSVASTGTFQSVQAKNLSRNGCAIENQSTNNSSDTMWVYFDPTNSTNCSAATKAGSATLIPGQSANCNIGTIVLSDQVCITGTSGDTFFANFQ
jgi:hypothetical protein